MRTLRITFLIVLLQSCVAEAYAIEYSATLAQPVAAEKEYVANGNIWRCKGETCFLISPPVDAASLRSCSALSRQAGALRAYGKVGHVLSAEDLTKCNEHARQ